MNIIESEKIIAFHPGYYLDEIIKEKKITKKQLAKKIGLNEKTISQLINGKIDLDEKMIDKISDYTKTSKQLWKNLNEIYQQKKKLIVNEKN